VKSRRVSANAERVAIPLVDHSFLAKVSEDIRPFLQAGLVVARALHGKVAPEKIGELGQPQPYDYALQVWTRLTAMLGSLHRMHVAAAMVRHCPPSSQKLGRLVTFRDWREYHSFVFYGSAVGVLDTALILTNAVYELGIPDRRCDREVVIGNTLLAHSPGRSALVRLDKLVASFRQKRNPFVHRGEAPDVSAGFGKEHEAIILACESGLPLQGCEWLAAESRKTISKTLATNWTTEAGSLHPASLALCDALLPVYDQHMQRKPSLADGILEFRKHLGLG
jgi:hypothetical protein